jgi:hypothetical protein
MDETRQSLLLRARSPVPAGAGSASAGSPRWCSCKPRASSSFMVQEWLAMRIFSLRVETARRLVSAIDHWVKETAAGGKPYRCRSEKSQNGARRARPRCGKMLPWTRPVDDTKKRKSRSRSKSRIRKRIKSKSKRRIRRRDLCRQRAFAKGCPNAHGIDQEKLNARIRKSVRRVDPRSGPTLTLILALNPLPNPTLPLTLSLLTRACCSTR